MFTDAAHTAESYHQTIRALAYTSHHIRMKRTLFASRVLAARKKLRAKNQTTNTLID
jgi:hypothetical protein